MHQCQYLFLALLRPTLQREAKHNVRPLHNDTYGLCLFSHICLLVEFTAAPREHCYGEHCYSNIMMLEIDPDSSRFIRNGAAVLCVQTSLYAAELCIDHHRGSTFSIVYCPVKYPPVKVEVKPAYFTF